MAKRHQRPFAYKQRTDGPVFLRPHSYKAQELLNATVASFYKVSDVDLTHHQGNAKRKFIDLFEAYARRPNTEFRDLEIHALLQVLMGYLDDFFFFGSVTAIVEKLDLRYFASFENHKFGYCRHVRTEASSRFEIHLNRRPSGIGRRNRLATVSELVSTLAHEMIHAFLGAFVCDCPDCMRNDFNAVGFSTSGHGPTFRGLGYAVMVSLASWSDELCHVLRGRTDGKFIDKYSLKAEKESIRLLELFSVASGPDGTPFLPYVKRPDRNLPIFTGEKKVVINVEQLRAIVKKKAASTGSFLEYVTAGVHKKRKRSLSSSAAGEARPQKKPKVSVPTVPGTTRDGSKTGSLKDRTEIDSDSSATSSDSSGDSGDSDEQYLSDCSERN
ncbi:hypothetical protein F5Y03DRAFT_404520 [Xylaria venustula]|nr:hypothetical protein F5Y03DRAFT_404520 [Xylaria venustula]